jgi:hypothetical protein
MNFSGEGMRWSVRWKWLLERRRQHPPDEIHLAGERAEQRLAKISRAAGKANGWHVFESVRIPDREQGGMREIDLVIVGGNRMLVVEQKHWSGSFEINADEEFIQHRKNGTTHNHSTVNQRIQRKAKMLEAMHCERWGEGEEIEVKVILAFTNRNLAWPENVDVLSSTVLDEAGFIAYLEDERSGQLNDNLLATIAGFGTWDEILLNGGRSQKGDLLDLGLGVEIERWLTGRTEALTGDISHKKAWRSLLSKAPSSIELQHGSHRLAAQLPYGLALKMHVVGEEQPREILWSTIDRLKVSKPPTSQGMLPQHET